MIKKQSTFRIAATCSENGVYCLFLQDKNLFEVFIKAPLSFCFLLFTAHLSWETKLWVSLEKKNLADVAYIGVKAQKIKLVDIFYDISCAKWHNQVDIVWKKAVAI